MSRRFILSPVVIIGIVLFLAVGELASGTALAYVAMMVVAMLAICVTYNLLGGLGTVGGVLFTGFALYTLVVSQFAKVFMFEAADLNLRSPELTIAVYAVYFLSLMVGVFLFGWIRLDLPRPLEPASSDQYRVMYISSFVLGLAATIYAIGSPNIGWSTVHGLARAFSLLLPLSLVLAVDNRIRETEGRYCFGWAAVLPTLVMEFLSFVAASRSGCVLPLIIVLATCYFRGYKFRARHYIVTGAMIAALFLFVSPWYLWTRGYRQQASFGQQVAVMAKLAAAAPTYWPEARNAVRAYLGAAPNLAGQYFTRTGKVTLNRLVLIPEDGAVISACSHYHWGLATIKIDMDDSIPHFIQANKPDRDGTWYRASVGGLQSSYAPSGYVTTSTIADAWGGFGWMGVIAVPLLLVPWLFVEWDSIFDMSRPWGTVAVTALSINFAVGGVGTILIGFMLAAPILILLVSWSTGWIVRHIPLIGDVRRRKGPLFHPERVRALAGE